MHTYHPNAAGSNESAMVLVTCCLTLLLCWLFFADFVRWSCWFLYWLWRFADFSQIHRYAAERINLLAATGNGSESVGFSEWQDVMNHTAGILFVPMAPLVVVTSWALARHPALGFRSRRAIDIHSLPRVMATFAPSVIPVLSGYRGDGMMNDTSPENAWALKPEEFAEQYGLIKRRVLDRDAAKALFDAQTGPAMTPPDQWQPYERALLAVFGLQVFVDDRKAATTLLDDLNRSCMIRRLFRAPEFRSVPDWRVAEAQLVRVLASPGVSEWLKTHGTVRSALVGLYGRDLHLAPARFRWLKGCDRTLWYGLHTADTDKVYVEGSGIVAQARAEQMAARLGLPRPPLMTDEAVEGLQLELESMGLVYPREARPKRAKPSREIPFPDALYLPDEGEDEFTDGAGVR
ncbi:intracellular multiplication protein IcmP [Kosakonia radicincitans]|uniref:Intracellular multiplication protein IcmP n=1 Tax=Kosakonia radicincitans TaxID=283686 RepID=A0AAX2EZG7_9ENTR|nr:conjugal transfer protein [Kosakonia radicincitans]SFF38315.1 intracellular multiplication protein IcmP [Kosakonia radicincitans]SFR26291.1 intracellular multiplication protein IcmP [Kosakonia radicincitans]SFU16787.1 intracellular multiplication protein IcmP [Kosakonia radicincitans]SFY32194.1 intracellular multiplication protein IcmP [Kosakonia radicincitans]